MFEWENGNKYKGEFVNDVRQGEGEMAWSDGSNYKGDWKGGFPNGIGTYKHMQGRFVQKEKREELASMRTIGS